MTDPISAQLFSRACARIPGGVNSPVRAFRAVGGQPVFIQRAQGAHLVGADGRRYLDYVLSWGPMILGHAHHSVVEAICAAAARGTSYGAPTEAEIQLAEAIAQAMPSLEMLRLTSSGTEAVMGALRAARGFTGRDLVVKFEGCYHGGADYLLVKAGSGLATLGEPDSGGVPGSIAATTINMPFNDLPSIRALFESRGSEIAAVIVEPVVGNMGCVPPEPGFLEGLRELTAQAGSLLVFDEVMTGFRLAWGGAQARFGIQPDLTTLGKVVGGGMPLAAYGGRRDVMSKVAPLGPVYQAGTLSGNPVAVQAGLATLAALGGPAAYDRLEAQSAAIEAVIREAAQASGVEATVQRVGSMLTVYFHPGPVRRWADAARCDTVAFGRWHAALLEAGVYWPPSQFEAAFVSLCHDETTLDQTRQAMTSAFRVVAAA